jgi:hypothetical protein
MKAFVTGCDKDYIDILDWFLEGYNKHIKIPLYIANFGFLKQYPNSFLVASDGRTWFYKPKAIEKVPADKIIWIDCDIEIKADISDMFDMLDDCDYLMSKDHAVRSDRWQTGIVGINNKQVLKKWFDRCEMRQERGDQEAFNIIAHEFKINRIPDNYHGLRLGKNNDIAKTIHWTGDDGKEIIREKIRKSEQKSKHNLSTN